MDTELKNTIFDDLRMTAEKKCIPISVLFELTYNCNLSCCHCYVVNEGRKVLSYYEIKDILNQLADERCLFLTLTGGEILTRNDFFDIATYARKKGFALKLFTNGTLITEEVADKIKQLNPLRVEISVYGAKSSTHDGITGVNGSFDKTIYAINLLVKRKIKTLIKSPLMSQNIREYREIISLAKEIGVEYGFDPTITPKDDGSKDPLRYRISNADLKNVLSDPLLNEEKLKGQPTEKLRKTIMFCYAGTSICKISPYGDVYPCVQLLINAGSLREKSFHEIWNFSEELAKIRSMRKSEMPKCATCDLLPYCNRCPGLSLLEEGDIRVPYPEACRFAKIKKEVMA